MEGNYPITYMCGILLDQLLEDLHNGNPNSCFENREKLNAIAMSFLYDYDIIENKEKSPVARDLEKFLRICNILYNNTDSELLPIEDGVYDILREKYNANNPDFQVGADITPIMSGTNYGIVDNTTFKEPVLIFHEDLQDKCENSFFLGELLEPNFNPRLDHRDFIPGEPVSYDTVSKRKHDTAHNHPELVGTLDKCKFVTCKEAIDRGEINDSNVKILERDFFAEQIKRGIIDPNRKYTMCCELKYDGVSVEADCGKYVVSARSRGDTGIGQASDMSPILTGYNFPYMPDGIDDTIGVKFEAIIQKPAMEIFKQMKNYPYKNCRTAIVGLTNSSDGAAYRDLITLVPLQVEDRIFHSDEIQGNRIAEIEFLNDFFSSKGCPLRYVVIQGNYIELLYQIKLFLEDAEYARNFIPFMYDGIVVSYVDPDVREALGRENFVNKYSMAVKFNALKKQTIFRGYSFTVGQDGTVTPMIHYDPVEFYGTIHPNSSGHSYKRFAELALRVGDIIDVEYINDVMPYVSKPFNDHNEQNTNPIVPFPTECPFCGAPIEISPSGKSAKCTNQNCKERVFARMQNMFSKLNLAEFGEATVKALGKFHLYEICNIYEEDKFQEYGFGDGEANQLKTEIHKFLTNPIKDYELFGSLGFTNVGSKTWQLIFNTMKMDDFVCYMTSPAELCGCTLDMLYDDLIQIKGVGPVALQTIFDEIEYFIPDIIYCMRNCKEIIRTAGTTAGKQIRATGFRDRELFESLRNSGYDADDNGSVTKSTDILLVPYEGFSGSSKLKKVSENCIIVPVEEFKKNPNYYLK